MQNTFTIDEIRKYILSQDSLGDVLYNLSVSKILEANELENEDVDWDDLDDDEIREMYSAKEFLENWKFYEEYTMTYDQNISWFKKASKILQNTFYWHPKECDKHAGWIDLASGLKIEG